MGRPSNTAQRRAQIVDAMLDVMAREGYEGASIAAIAEVADLTPGLLHYHFSSKQQMLLAAIEALVAMVHERFAQRVAAAGSTPAQRLDAFIDARLALDDRADSRAVGAWVAIGAEALRNADVRAVFHDAIRRDLAELEALVAQCLAAGARQGGASEIAIIVLTAIEGAFFVGGATPDVLPAGFAAPAIRKMAAAMIAGL